MREIIEKKYTPLEIGPIVEIAMENPAELVRSSEEYYNNQVMDAAKKIVADKNCNFVLLCGPSASGKTTTAHKLKHRLIALGVNSQVVSMDDFFRGIKFYPKLPDGNPDMESFLAIDHELLNSCFEKLLLTGEAMFPRFDFVKQSLILDAHKVAFTPDSVIIMEGIHALNPAILSNIPHSSVFRIYVSVRSKFINGGENILIPKDIRLVRRMVRDNNFRNYSPLSTLSSWGNVVASERVNIDLYRDDVNLKIDNTIVYEVCIWRHMLSNLLEPAGDGAYDAYPEVQRIFSGLKDFPSIAHELIPKNSLLREFVGDHI